MDLCNELCLSGQPANHLAWQKLMDIFEKMTLHANHSIKFAMPGGAIAVSHFPPLSLTLTMPGGHKGS